MRSSARRSRATAVAVASAIIAALAGCAPAVNPPPSASASHTSSPAPTAEPQSASPVPLLGGDCSKLISLADVKSATGVPEVALAPTQPLNQVYQIPIAQAGGLDCDWHDAGHATDLDVAVLPNSRAALDAQSPRLDANDDGKDAAHIANVPTYGDESWTHCFSLGEDPSDGCSFDIRVGTFWIEVNQAYGGTFTAYPQASGVRALLTKLVSAVRSLPPVHVWKPDVRGLTLPKTCDATLPLATLRSETEAADLTQHADAATFNPLLDGSFVSTGSLYCQWFTSQNEPAFALVMLPGSTWAWSASTGVPSAAAVVPLSAQTGLGSAAFGGCQTSDLNSECDLFVLANHTWFELTQDSAPQHPVALPALTSLAHTILGRIGYQS
jgi:hypothetical protein